MFVPAAAMDCFFVKSLPFRLYVCIDIRISLFIYYRLVETRMGQQACSPGSHIG